MFDIWVFQVFSEELEFLEAFKYCYYTLVIPNFCVCVKDFWNSYSTLHHKYGS